MWSLDPSHFVEYSVDEVMGRTEVDLREKKKTTSYEDWWVECEPAGAPGSGGREGDGARSVKGRSTG